MKSPQYTDSQTIAVPRSPARAASVRLMYGLLGTWLIMGAPLLLYIAIQPNKTGGTIPIVVIVLGVYLLTAVVWLRKGTRFIQSAFWNGFLYLSCVLVLSGVQGVFAALSGIHIPNLFLLNFAVAFLGFWWLENRKVVH